jgi:hypothetical protein
VKQGLVHELVNVKLIVLSDAGGAFGAGFVTYASHLMVSEAGARGDAGVFGSMPPPCIPNKELKP